MQNLSVLSLGAAAFLLTAPTICEARPIPEVQRFLREEITKLKSVEEPSVPKDGSYAPMGDYQLSLFRLRLKAEFGFDVGVAKVTLEPIAEFFWE